MKRLFVVISVLSSICFTTNSRWCYGDFDCDADVDADDVTKFLEDFGREQYYNPCPACVAGAWCVY